MILVYGLVTLPLYLEALSRIGLELFVLAEDLRRAMRELEENPDLVGVVFGWDLVYFYGGDWEAFLALVRQKELPLIVLTVESDPAIPPELRGDFVQISANRALTQAILRMAGGVG